MKQLLTILMLVWAIPAMAQYGSGNGVYGTLGGIQQLAAQGVVTNESPNVSLSTNLASVNFSQTNFLPATLIVTNCAFFPFLNSTNAPWLYMTNQGCWTQGGTNFLFIDNSGNQLGWMFAKTNFSFDGSTGVFEEDSHNLTTIATPIAVSPWARASDFANDTTVVLFGGTGFYNTNFIARPSEVDMYINPPAIMSPSLNTFSLRSGSGFDLLHFTYNVGAGGNGQIDLYGYDVGNPFNGTTSDSGQQTGKINFHVLGKGTIPGWAGSGDDRSGAVVGFYFGNMGEFGQNMEFLTTSPTNYTSKNSFNRNLVLDAYGSVTVAYPNMTGHGTTNPAVGRLDVWPDSNVTNQPTIVLHAGNLSTTKYNGSIDYDGTNFYGTASLNGSNTNRLPVMLGPVVIQTNWIDGKFYTNTYNYPITVTGPVKWTTAGVAGDVCEALWIVASPNNGGTTNYVAAQTLVTSLAQSVTNPPCTGFIPTNAAFCWTNLSTGSGDSAAVLPGQIKYP